jgi:hypothetical protein
LPVGYVFYSPADNFLYTAFWVRGNTSGPTLRGGVPPSAAAHPLS